ncbi:MAG: ABC transporter permease [Burkholderiaceae bacterium]
MAFQVLPRTEASATMRLAAPVGATVLMLIIGAIFLVAMGKSPALGWQAFIAEPLGSLDGLSELLLKAVPLFVIALGLTAGFRSGVWNIGAEGQLIIGAIAAAWLAVVTDGMDGWWILPAMMLVAGSAGAAWAAIPAFLRVRYRTNEILVSLMLVYVATFVLTWVIYGPLKDPQGMGFPQSILFSDPALFSPLSDEFRLNTTVWIALAALPLFWIYLDRSFAGYQLQVGGLAPLAAGYAGYSGNRAIWTSLLLGGFCAGLAGAFEVGGPLGQLTKDVSNNYGFAAIIVAFLGRLHPLGILIASLLMSMLYIGGDKAQVMMDLPNAITGLFQGLLLLLLLACDFLVNNRVQWRRIGAPA